MARTNSLANYLTDVADAIRTKKGDNSLISAYSFDTEILNLPSGGSIPTEKDVNFYDYDGTLTNSYTKEEFLDLESLPSNPSHEGLIAQGWNWSLADAQDYVTDFDSLYIGQSYITDDNKTRIYVSIDDNTKDAHIMFGLNGTAIIDWGDNTTTTSTGDDVSMRTDNNHTYTQAGDYIVTISIDGNAQLKGNSGYSFIFWNGEFNQFTNMAYNGSIKKIELGNNISLEDNCLNNLSYLKSITIPTSITEIPTDCFATNYSLEHLTFPINCTQFGLNPISSLSLLKTISLPNGITNIPDNFMRSCGSIKNVTIPKSVTSSGQYCFQHCTCLESVKMPPVAIGNYFFDNCYALKEFNTPAPLTTLDNRFSFCYNLKNVVLPNTLTSIDYQSFYNCRSLPKLVIPAGVTSIAMQAFYGCRSLKLLDFTNLTAIPTLANSNAFTATHTSLKIVVPDSLYSDWIVATNWSNVASKIVKESDYNA